MLLPDGGVKADTWACSLVGKASALQAEEREFEPLQVHHWVFILESFAFNISQKVNSKSISAGHGKCIALNI